MGTRTGKRRNPHADYRTPPEDMLMSMVRMVDDFPPAMRAAKLRLLADEYREMFEDSEVPCPEWVGMLAARADEMSVAEGSPEEGARRH